MPPLLLRVLELLLLLLKLPVLPLPLQLPVLTVTGRLLPPLAQQYSCRHCCSSSCRLCGSAAVFLPRLVLLPANLKGPGVLLLLQSRCRHSLHLRLLVCTLTTQAALAAATALTTLSPLLLFLPGWCSCRHCCSCLRCICSFCCTCHGASSRRRLRLNCFASTGPGSSRNLSQEAMLWQTQACQGN